MLLTNIAPITLASATGKSLRKKSDDIFEMKARTPVRIVLCLPSPIGDGEA